MAAADDAPRPLAYLLVAALSLGSVVGFFAGTDLDLPDVTAFWGRGDETAPDFTIRLAEGGSFTLSAHRGEVVVLDLMAVDCASCRITEKAMLELDRTRPDVTIVSVDIWTTLEDEAYLRQHMRSLGADWPYGMDTDDLLFKYDAYEISKVVVIDRDGYITWQKVGGIEAEPLIEAVDEASAGGAARQSTLGFGIVGFAVFAGVASFFAPCAFPLLPGYMAYALSLRQNGPAGASATATGPPASGTRATTAGGTAPSTGTATATGTSRHGSRVRDALVPGFAAAGGILLVYGVFGVIVAVFGQAAAPWLPYLQPGVGVLAIVLGIALLLGASMERVMAPLQLGIERLRRRISGRETEGTWVGYFSYGLGYGAAAAGCVAPVFLQLTLTAIALGVVTGLQVFAVYAGVAALLMVLATIVAVKARGVLQRQAGKVVRVVNRGSGVVLVAAGIYLLWFFDRGFGLPGL